MATTYYVRSSGGSDGGGAFDGSEYSKAFATIEHAYDILQSVGTKGDVIKVVNDGVHAVPPSSVVVLTNAALSGTSFSDPGFVIEGSDTVGNPATASCAAGTSGRFLRLGNNAKYAIVRGLTIDMTASTGGNNVVLFENANAGPCLMEACHIIGYSGAIGTLSRAVYEGTVGVPDYGIIRYCILENCVDTLRCSSGSTTKKISVHHTVVLFSGDWSNGFTGTLQVGTVPVNAGDVVEFYHNTLYINDTGGSAIASVFDWGPAAGDTGTVNYHSNYGWLETAGTITQIIAGSAGSTATYAGTIGYNTIYFGPSVVIGDNSGLLYEAPWDGGVDPKATDSTAYTQASTVLFNNPAVVWVWEDVNGLGYDLTVARDLRPIIRLTSSSTGGVPGALPAAQSDFAVDLITSRTNPSTSETVTLTFTLTNTGAQAASILASLPVPTGLTYVSSVASQGSYVSSTGVWTVGSMLSSTSVTLTVTVSVDDDQGGNTITPTASYTSSDVTDTNAANDSDSVILSIVDDTDPGGGGDGANPYLDVLPIFADYLTLDASCRFQTKVNRIIETYVRFDKRTSRFREFSDKRIIVAPSTTLTINMGGVQRGKYIVVEADSAVRVSLSTSGDKYLPAATVVFVAMSDFEILKVQNQSSTTAATVQIGVVD